MNAKTEAHLTEIQEIEASLDAILTAITLHDEKPRTDGPRVFKTYSIDELMKEFDENQARTEEGRFAHKLRRDPVREALCYALRRLGKRLHEIGGLNAMIEACDRVADMDERRWGKRTSIMDHRWDGIGRANGNPGWCS